MASPAVSFENGMSARVIGKLVSSSVSLQVKTRMRHIGTKMIFGTSLMDNEVSKVIYTDFLPGALADRRYVAAPDPYVVGQGLEQVQTGLDVQRKGVSAKKVVVSL